MSLFADASAIAQTWQDLSTNVKETPVLTCSTIDNALGARLFFKCENFQKSGAFKYRGASSAMLAAGKQMLANGVCTHSSGNHAQALALAARIRGVKAYIVMPDNAPEVKVEAVKAYGGEITFCQPTLEARESTLKEIQTQTGALFIHPYNDYNIIRGQAGCFYEMSRQLGFQPDYVITPLGGGGLLSGTILSARAFCPHTRILGAEPLNASDALQSLRQKKFIPSQSPQTIADGLKTSLGSITYPLIMEHVEDIITATEESIVQTMFWVWERMKIVIEPSAAVPLAALRENPDRFANKTVAIVFSGGNVDLRKLPWLNPSV